MRHHHPASLVGLAVILLVITFVLNLVGTRHQGIIDGLILVACFVLATVAGGLT